MFFVALYVVEGGHRPLQWRQSGSTERWFIDRPVVGPPQNFCGALLGGEIAIG